MPDRIDDEMERLSPPECYRLLASRRLGRIGLVVEGHPEIFPVNYALLDELIVFRTAPGTKLEHSFMESAVFEVDDVEEDGAWSVAVKGIVQELAPGSALLARAQRELELRPDAPGERSHWLAVHPIEVTGRRF
jgi:nitroimidazol reductase NimA-like FMN-containing flavoprotein (pyridoxamine 5'-phosphate oxidase superfamily)